MMDESLRELYQEVILDHSRHPRHFGALANATHSGEGHNPLCGDRVKIYLSLDKNDRIADIKFEGKGCAISQASASLMTDMVVGRTVAEAEKLMGGFLNLVKGEDVEGPFAGRSRTAGSDGRRLGVSHAGEMRNACLAHDEIGSGGRRSRQDGMNAEPAKIEASKLTPEELEAFTARLVAAIKTVYDPEIPVDIYELGLIYKVDVADNKDVAVDMTLTAPGCPVAGEMPGMVKSALETVEGIGEITVNMVFDPPWTPDNMSEEAKLELNMF